MLMRVIVSHPPHRPSGTQERRRAWGLRKGLRQSRPMSQRRRGRAWMGAVFRRMHFIGRRRLGRLVAGKPEPLT